MPFATVDGISTRYEEVGSGEPILMYAPGGFDATIEKWSALGLYGRTNVLTHLSRHYRCILFDRRECGQSGGRIERVTWGHYVAQGKGLLDHLGIDRAHILGGCMGCPPVLAFGVAHPPRVLSLVLIWPVGGVKYRISSRQRFAEHLAFVQQHGLEAVATFAAKERKAFNADARGGPWGSVLAHDADFAATFAGQDLETYKLAVLGTEKSLYDRDTAPGAEPEDLLRLDLPAFIVPGHDPAHATSAARYLEECLPGAQYWDAMPEAQTEESLNPRLLAFLADARAP